MLPRSKPGTLRRFILLSSYVGCCVAVSALTPAFAQSTDPSPPLTTATQVARFPSIDPENQPPVKLEAAVVFIDPTGTVFLQDGTGSTFLRGAPSGKQYRPGQRIAVEGIRIPGLFIGGIAPSKVTVLGEAPLPLARPITREELASGHWHYQLVEINGVGRALESTGENAGLLHLNTPGGIVSVRFDELPPHAADFIDAKLCVHGLAAGSINDRRQLVTPYVWAQNSQSVQITKAAPADAFAEEALAMDALQPEMPHRVKVKGIALAAPFAGHLFLRDGKRSLYVQMDGPVAVAAGDEVEAAGFVEMGPFTVRIVRALCRVIGSNAPPLPLAVTDKQLADGRDAELITATATVLQRTDLNDRTEINAKLGNVSLTLLAPHSLPEQMQSGSEIQFTGLCRVTATRHEGYRARPNAYDVYVRSPQNLVLLKSVPWWNAERFAAVLSVVGLLALLAMAWAGSLRRQVRKQLAVIEAKAQREAVMEERQRIAREFHDTLEQELAGLSLRLDAATTRVQDEKALTLLEQLRKLLLRLQTETRDFVWDLRASTVSEAALDSDIRSLLDHLQGNTSSELHLTCENPVPPMPPLQHHHLLRLTREAVHNAIKHAQATRITVSLATADGKLTLRIIDDGRGFDPSAKAGLQGHFGLQGMRERVRKMGADLQVTSQPGQGTTIEVSLALPTATD